MELFSAIGIFSLVLTGFSGFVLGMLAFIGFCIFLGDI